LITYQMKAMKQWTDDNHFINLSNLNEAMDWHNEAMD
jgi:hypothetical protein